MKTGQAQEFSMDDVLESIRRIISDGETPADADRSAADPAISRGFLEGFEQAARTVSLADPEGAPAPRAVATTTRREVQTPGAAPARVERAPAVTPRPAVAPRPAAPARAMPSLRGTTAGEPAAAAVARPAPAAPAALPADRLLSQAAEHAVESAFGSLGSVVVSRQSQTIEDLVKDLMRPMVSAWLDRNLPSLVERLVQAEIQRLSRRD